MYKKLFSIIAVFVLTATLATMAAPAAAQGPDVITNDGRTLYRLDKNRTVFMNGAQISNFGNTPNALGMDIPGEFTNIKIHENRQQYVVGTQIWNAARGPVTTGLNENITLTFTYFQGAPYARVDRAYGR